MVAVIWDLDGVLVDSLPLRMEGLRRLAKKTNAQIASDLQLRRLLCHGPRFMLNTLFGKNVSLREFENLCRRLARDYIEPFPRIPEVLNALNNLNVRQALVTSRTLTDARDWLAICRIPRVFEVVLTYSDRFRPKPNPASLLAAVERMNLGLQEVAYIGDTIEDGEACSRAGITFLLAGWGTPNVDEVLAGTRPNTIMNIPSDVLTWISKQGATDG